jgi:hypothetical protein
MGYEKHKRPLVAPSFTPAPNGIALADLVHGTDGQIPIAQTGLATAYKSTSGDATLDKNGVVTIGAGKVTGAKRTEGAGFLAVAVPGTNGVTPVNVFGVGGAPCALIITAAFVVALDDSAGNITMQQGVNTVFTAAKGTAPGAFVDGGALTHATYAKGDVCTVKSTGGDAKVYLFFTVG